MRVNDDGGLEVIDPGFDALPLLREVDPGYAIQARALPGFVVPRILDMRACRASIGEAAAAVASIDHLWAAHDAAVSRWRSGMPAESGAGMSLLDLKAVIAKRLLSKCVLCARRCGVDRAVGQVGMCGLKMDAHVAEHFVHIAEEAFINPSLVLNLRGCALRCRACQQHELLDTRGSERERLSPELWQDLSFGGARSLSVVGGNPDESLPAILEFLAAAPTNFVLPIVWNNHAYMSDQAIRLLQGTVDCYIPDLKFYSEACSRPYLRVADYPQTAHHSISHLLQDGVPVIVRILVMPGHGECCHLRSLAWLAEQRAENLFVSLRRQYAPDWRITSRDGKLADRVDQAEFERVASEAARLGLRLVS